MLALSISAGVWGQYNPTNPAEPGAPVKQYTLTLVADPSGGGSFNLNATSSQTEGTTFWVQANTAANFTFVFVYLPLLYIVGRKSDAKKRKSL